MAGETDTVRLGPYRLDLEKRLLWRDDQLVSLTPKAASLLATLVEARGDLVTKEELLARVWPDTVVGEANLSVTVSSLRKALGPADEGAQYVVTVPRRGYRLGVDLEEAPTPPITLAVLPFRPLGDGEADRHLGLGMADAVIARLTRLQGLAVRPLGSVRKYADAPADPEEVGRLLGVDAVLDGSLQRLGSRVRVSAHLLPLGSALRTWADTFEEELPDIFDLQDAVAEQLLAALRPRLGSEARPGPRPRHNPGPDAYESYLRGRYFWGRLGAEDLERAFSYFQRAAEQDPDFGLPHTGLAEAYVLLGLSGLLPPARAWSMAESEARRALELEPEAAEPQVALGFVALFRDRDPAAARAGLEGAVVENPGASAPRQWLALLLALEGDVTAAGREIDRARELDPLSPIANTVAAFQRALARKDDEGLELARRVVELDPRLFLGHWSLGLAEARAGRFHQAIAEHRLAVELGANAPFLRAVLAWTLACAGEREEAGRLLDELAEAGGSPYQRATILAALGETDDALAALRAAWESGDPWAILIGVDPMLDPVRSRPELAELGWTRRR